MAFLHKRAIPQHGIPVGQGEDLRHLVGNEDEGGPLFLPQIPQQIEQMGNFLVVQGGGGLVQDDEFCVPVQGTGDFHQLLLAGFQSAYQSIRVDLYPQPLEEFRRLAAHLPFPQTAQGPRQLPGQKDIFVDFQVVD